MGSSTSKPSVTWDEYVKSVRQKLLPKENCPPEIIEVIKAENTEKIRENIRTAGHENPLGFRFNVGVLPCIDQEWQEHTVRVSEVKGVHIKDGNHWDYADVIVPKTYRNGSERLITDTEITDIIKSITSRPFVFERSWCTCVVKYVQ